MKRLSRKSFRRALWLSGLLFLCSLGSCYALSATTILRSSICQSFSLDAPNPYCRTGIYWDIAWIACTLATIGLVLSALVFRPRANQP
jgi:hypothetical protein